MCTYVCSVRMKPIPANPRTFRHHRKAMALKDMRGFVATFPRISAYNKHFHPGRKYENVKNMTFNKKRNGFLPSAAIKCFFAIFETLCRHWPPGHICSPSHCIALVRGALCLAKAKAGWYNIALQYMYSIALTWQEAK